MANWPIRTYHSINIISSFIHQGRRMAARSIPLLFTQTPIKIGLNFTKLQPPLTTIPPPQAHRGCRHFDGSGARAPLQKLAPSHFLGRRDAAAAAAAAGI